ncbi:MAG: acyl-CoA dehydratase activase [Candidatus Xenobiia bacterium LiM19]
MICAGIDTGSRAIKIALIDSETHLLSASGIIDQGIDHESRVRSLFDRLCSDCGIASSSVTSIVATGCSRQMVGFASTTITEISCHARGVNHLIPDALTVVEIGGQDSKLIHLSPLGKVRDFSMNDRCAAGTGRFLEILASRLEVDLCTLGEMALRSTEPAAISSMCVVFAETEIIGLLASGVSPDDIAAGLQTSFAARIAAMAGKNLASPVAFTGGVALIPSMKRSLESALGHPVLIPPDPQLTGALGAALLAAGA